MFRTKSRSQLTNGHLIEEEGGGVEVAGVEIGEDEDVEGGGEVGDDMEMEEVGLFIDEMRFDEEEAGIFKEVETGCGRRS